MNIPDHLVELVRELATAHRERTDGDFRTLDALRPGHEQTFEQKRRAEEARELCAHVQCHKRAVA